MRTLPRVIGAQIKSCQQLAFAMTELSCLFEQIFHSERNFKARVDHLKALNVKIQELELKLEQTRDELHIKKGELAVKNSKLADVEMEVKLLQLRKGILIAQRREVTEAKNKTSEDYKAMVSDSATTKQIFRGKLMEFSQCYDLHGSGLKYRDEEDKKKIAILQDELILLETEIVEVESYLEDVKKLQEELDDAENELNREKEKEKDLQTVKLEQEAQILELKNKKISSTQAFSNSDLKRLQSELDACKNSPEEQRCEDLGKELGDLQRKCYHKQMKLQTARQSKMVAPNTARNPYTVQQHPPCPEMTTFSVQNSENRDEDEVIINLVDDDDEWLEAGTIDNFDSGDHNDDDDDDMDDDVFMDVEWYVDEVELNRNSNPPTSVGYQEAPRTTTRQKSFPPAGSKYSGSATDFQTREQRQRNRFPQTPKNRGAQSLTVTTTPRQSQPKTVGAVNSRAPQSRNTGEFEGALSVSSPFSSNVTRKRPGESIFKAPKTQNQNSPKRAKKVRFQY